MEMSRLYAGWSFLRCDPARDFLLSVGHLQDVFFLWRPALPDPDDDLILELASAAGCRYIITHNIADFRGTEKWGVAAVRPSDFLKIIETTK